MRYEQAKQFVAEFKTQHGRCPNVNELRFALAQMGMRQRTEVYYFIHRLKKDGLDILPKSKYVDMTVLNALYGYWKEHGHSPTAAELRRITGLPAYTSLGRLENQGLIKRQYRGYWPNDLQFLRTAAMPRLVQFIIDYTNQHGRQPTYEEMAKAIGCAKSTLCKRLKQLAAMGIITHKPYARRAIIIHNINTTGADR